MKSKTEENTEKLILLISFLAGLLFAIIEFIFAYHSHSQSALMDAVYDSSELVFIVLIIFLTPLFHKPVTEKRPYGFYQLEPICIIVKGLMLLSVSFTVAISVVDKAINGGNSVNSMSVAIFQLGLGVMSICIYQLIKKLNKSLSSPTIDAELIAWKLDIYYSIGLALAFFISNILSKTFLQILSPYVDQVIAISIMILMLPENLKMLWSAIKDIFLFTPDKEVYNEIKQISVKTLEENECSFSNLDIIRTGRYLWIDIYFKVDETYFNKYKLEELNKKIEKQLNMKYDNCNCELILIV